MRGAFIVFYIVFHTGFRIKKLIELVNLIELVSFVEPGLVQSVFERF